MSNRMFVEVKNYNDSADAIIHTDTRTVCVEFASNPEVDINGTVSFDIPEWSLITEESLIERGHNEAWDLSRTISNSKLYDKQKAIFGTCVTADILRGNSYSEAVGKIEKWNNAKNSIELWDEVETDDGKKGTVINICDQIGTYYVRFEDGIKNVSGAELTRTGRKRVFDGRN